MSSRHNLQDATGVLGRHPTKGVYHTVQTTAPSNGAVGYMQGCLWVNRSAAAGARLWLNEGTYSSAVWVNLDGLVYNRTANALVATALSTVGAGTITAAGIVGGVTARGGAQSGTAFTDTTATAAQIVTAIGSSAVVGQAWTWRYQNNTNAFATLAGGTGVTLSGITVVPPNAVAEFLVTYSGAGAVTIAGIGAGKAVTDLPECANYTQASTSQSQTYTAAKITGARQVTLELTGTVAGGAITGTLDTTANIIAAIPNAQPGMTYRLRIRNVASTQTITLTAGDVSTTINGTATIATNTFRDFDVTVASATTLTFQNVGAGNV